MKKTAKKSASKVSRKKAMKNLEVKPAKGGTVRGGIHGGWDHAREQESLSSWNTLLRKSGRTKAEAGSRPKKKGEETRHEEDHEENPEGLAQEGRQGSRGQNCKERGGSWRNPRGPKVSKIGEPT